MFNCGDKLKESDGMRDVSCNILAGVITVNYRCNS